MKNTILLYNSGGGLGDSIQLFPLILSLKNHFNNSEFYYLGAHENHYIGKLKDYDIKIQTLNLDLKYFGFRWWHYFIAIKRFKKLGFKKFDLIIDLQSKLRNTIILKQLPTEKFYSPTFNYRFCTKLHNGNSFNKPINNYGTIQSIIFNLKYFLNINFKNIDYSLEKISKKYHNEAIKLLPNKNYVGFSLTQGNVYRKKEWPIDNVIKLAEELVKKNKVPVFLIEKKHHQLKDKIKNSIPLAVFPEYETNISCPALVTCLGNRLDLAITIDNGIMHMLALSKIPMISLFGPTDSKKFAPIHKNSIVLDSKKIYNSKNIANISVEDVLRVAKQLPGF
jgi:ADP-heptose:LPS heptosyltransferase